MDVSAGVHAFVRASVLVLVLVVRGSAEAVCSVVAVAGPYVVVPVLVPLALSRVLVPVVVVGIVGVVAAPGSVVCLSVVVPVVFVLVLVFCSVSVFVFLSIVVVPLVVVALLPRPVFGGAASFVRYSLGFESVRLPVWLARKLQSSPGLLASRGSVDFRVSQRMAPTRVELGASYRHLSDPRRTGALFLLPVPSSVWALVAPKNGRPELSGWRP